MTTPAQESPQAVAERLAAAGVRGVTIAWADNNGIPRSRTVPVRALPAAARAGVGITPLFAVFDSHDGITHEYPGLGTPSGDVRLVPDLGRVRQLAGQPHLALAPGQQVDVDGVPTPYDQRGLLRRQVERAGREGLGFRVGYELEFVVSRVGEPGQDLVPGHRGPAYSPHALIDVDGFVDQLLGDLAANGLDIGQLHAEYGQAQIEISLDAADPVSAADDQLLARQTVHAAAAAHGLRASFAPLWSAEGVGNGWHLHSSVWRDGVNLLAPTGDGTDRHGLGRDGAAYVAGLLHELPALTALTTPSVPSFLRLRPGYFAGAYRFWGVENREAPLRHVPGGALLGPGHANVELKASDASANPYLAIAAVIAAGLAGIRDGLRLPEPIQEDPGTWTEQRRAGHGLALLPQSPAEAEGALLKSDVVQSALTEQALGAFLAVRHADAAWAEGKAADELVAGHRWLY